MNTNINNFETIINATIESVWNAIATTEGLAAWAPTIRVETDWQVGSPVTYTCFDEKGEIVEWEGKKMVWSGMIETLDKPNVYTCVYPESETGIERETYTLELIDENTSRVTLDQTCTTPEVAEKYKLGTQEMMDMMKKFLEEENNIKI